MTVVPRSSSLSLPRRRPLEMIETLVPLAGRRVVDVGCGDGSLARALAARGAKVTGIEVNPEHLARARAAPPVAGETFLEGAGEALPLPDASADLVIFLNSLHHVPVPRMDQALAEAARVLAPGGQVLVHEPLAEGPFFELCRPVDDETGVRAAAYAALGRAPAVGLEPVSETVYLNDLRFEDFPAFAARVVGADPTRADRLRRLEGELRDAFTRLGEPDNGGVRFAQPSRINLLRVRT